MKKILPFFFVLLLLASCAAQTTPPPIEETPVPTPISSPIAVVEGAKPDLLTVFDGKYSGVISSTGEVIYPCEYTDIERIAQNRVVLSKMLPSGDGKSSEYTSAIGDFEGNLLTDFVYGYVRRDLADTGLIFAAKRDGSGTDILNAETCAPIWEMPGEVYGIEGSSALAGTFLMRDEKRALGLYSIANLLAGDTEPLEQAEGVSYSMVYDDQSGRGLYYMENGEYLLFGGDGSTPAVQLQEVRDCWDSVQTGKIPARLGGRWGFVDFYGNVVIPAQFDGASPFYGGLAAVEVNDLYGFIDETGTVVIPPKFTQTTNFMGGFALVDDGAESGYLIDKTGAKVMADVTNIYHSSVELDIAQIECESGTSNVRKTWLARGGKLFEMDMGEGVSVNLSMTRNETQVVYGYHDETGVSTTALFNTETGEFRSEPRQNYFYDGVRGPLNASLYLRSDCVVGTNTERWPALMELLDDSGEPILSGVNRIYSVGNAVAAVQKGFSWGIMDFSGNWICEYSVFNSMGIDD